MRIFPASLALACALLGACSGDVQAPAPTAPAAGPALRLHAEPWPLPADASAAQPDLVAAPDGSLLLSWLAPDARGHQLRYARFSAGRWQPARQIARGNDWFVNWADTPHLRASADGALWAQWLRRSAGNPHAYDVLLARSADGWQWSAPVTVHDDRTATEHGFVSLWPEGADGMGIAWLDGRRTAGTGHGDGHGQGNGQGAMTLRSARFDARLRKHDEQELDAMTCDCCQTGAHAGASGILLVYRGRDAGEVRDIHLRRRVAGGWQPARRVHADDWVMPACPVNGPAVTAYGDEAWVAWYTAPQGEPLLRLAHSGDGGATFGAPRAPDRGTAVQGRAQVAADADGLWLAWLREDARGQSLWLARYSPSLERELGRLQVALLQGRGRGTGFPRLLADRGNARLVWTDVVAGRPVLRGAVVSPVAATSAP
ncbi:MAG: hypothetical protein AB7D31_12335 [Stenotrophomonas sp.]